MAGGLLILIVFVLYELIRPKYDVYPAPEVGDLHLNCLAHLAAHDGLTGKFRESYPDSEIVMKTVTGKEGEFACPEGG